MCGGAAQCGSRGCAAGGVIVFEDGQAASRSGKVNRKSLRIETSKGALRSLLEVLVERGAEGFYTGLFVVSVTQEREARAGEQRVFHSVSVLLFGVVVAGAVEFNADEWTVLTVEDEEVDMLVLKPCVYALAFFSRRGDGEEVL